MATQNRPSKNQPENRFQQIFRNSFFPAIFVLILLYFLFSSISPPGNEISYSTFKNSVKENRIKSVVISKNSIEGEMIQAGGKKVRFTTSRVEDEQLIPLLESKGVDFKAENRSFGA